MKVTFEVGDLVRLTNEAYGIYGKQVIWNENAFIILSIEHSSVTLSDINGVIPIKAIEPIPINGIADACIYYEPVIAANIVADGMPLPIHKKNLSYYINGFATMHIDNTTLKDLFLEQGFQFVHQVQHWLREDFDEDNLKINQTIKPSVRS